MVVMVTGRPLTSSVRREGEATTTGRMEYIRFEVIPSFQYFPFFSFFAYSTGSDIPMRSLKLCVY